MVIDIPMCFYGRGFEFHCFQVIKLNEDGKNNRRFCSEDLFLQSFSTGTKIGEQFSIGDGTLVSFSSGRKSHQVNEKGVSENLKFLSFKNSISFVALLRLDLSIPSLKKQ